MEEQDQIVDLTRLNNNTIIAIRDNPSIFDKLTMLDKMYIGFRADPNSFNDDFPYRPAPLIVSKEALEIINDPDNTINELLDLTRLTPNQLVAIADDSDAFAYLNFQEQVWLYNSLGRQIQIIEPTPFFPSKYLTTVIEDALSIKGGKRKKSRKPSSHYKPTKSRKTRRRK